MGKIENDIATLEREIAVLDKEATAETEAPAELLALHLLRTDLAVEEGKADAAKHQSVNLQAILDEAAVFRKSIPAVVRDRRMSVRRLELASGPATDSHLLSLHRHDAGTDTLEAWAANFEDRMSGMRAKLTVYENARSEAEHAADRIRGSVREQEAAIEKESKRQAADTTNRNQR